MQFSSLLVLVLAAVVSSAPVLDSRAPLSPDPSGQKNVGNGKGVQFITGQCLSNADCGSGCCATLGAIGICSGTGAATQQGKTGCGFGGGAAPPAGGAAPPPPPPAQAAGGAVTPATGAAASGLKPDPAGVSHIGNGQGQQFITGQCLNAADCNSGCCATLPLTDGTTIGICSGTGAATQAGKQGCGFAGGAAAPAAANNAAAAAPPPPPAAAPPAAAGGSGKPPGTQFITGPCSADADCASTCCGAKTGVCNALAVANGPGGGGCGGKAGAAAAPAAAAPPAAAAGGAKSVTPATGAAASGLKPDPAGVKNIGNGKGTQFITGQCVNAADCNSACCATLPLTDGTTIGICSGTGAATQAGKLGCGFSA